MYRLTLTMSALEAAFVAGSCVLMMRKNMKVEGKSSDFYYLLGLSLLNRLDDQAKELENKEVQDIIKTAVETAMELGGETEELCHECADGVPEKDAEKLM
jgi:hypothetical protein